MNLRMIAISGCPKSQYYSSICTEAWQSLGYSVRKFEATTPETLGNELAFAEKKFSGKPFTPTEKAIWYSHFRLWQTVRTPTHIIEHDTYPTKLLQDFSDKPAAIFSIFPRNDSAWQGRREHISPGSGYYITLSTASILIDYARSMEITENVDGFIYQQLKRILGMEDKEFNEYHLNRSSCFQIVNYDVGTSAQHNT